MGTVVLTGILLGVAAYSTMSAVLRANLRAKLSELVGTASVSIDPELHATLASAADMESPAYLRMRGVLQRVQGMSPDIRFLYTFRKIDDAKLYFVLDSGVPGQDFSPYGQVYTDLTSELRSAFEKPYAIKVEDAFYSDEYGTWLSAYAPLVLPDGRLEAVLGLDMSAARIVSSERSLLLIILGVTGAVTLVMVGAGFWFSRRISRPLLALSADMQRIQEFKLDGEIDLKTSLSEVITMVTSLENMKKGLRSFRKYVPADLVAELISLKKEAILETEKRELTIFFSDLENFTALSESLPTDGLTRFLETYFQEVTSALERRGATVDKFIGDAVMAFWNAPRTDEDHAYSACLAAMEVQSGLRERAAAWEAQGLPAVNTRIGLNTGICIVGNVGDASRMSYTALGDAVNLASRLESLNKYYGTRLLIGEETLIRLKGRIPSRPVDRVAVKGRTEPTLISELFPQKEPWHDDYALAWDAYRAEKWQEACKLFLSVVKAHPDDGPSLLLARRCKKFATEGVPADWTGTWIMNSK